MSYISLAIITILIVAVTTIALTPFLSLNIKAQVQQNQNQTNANVKALFKNEQALNNLVDQLHRKSLSAELHGNSTAKGMYITQHNLVVCILNTLFNNNTMFPSLNELGATQCDQSITSDIADHNLGGNQTIIGLGMQYLNVRGIR